MDETKIDAAMMGRLAQALEFICGVDHAAVKALRLASTSGSERDVKAARAQFLKLKSGDRQAAFAMVRDD